MLAGGAGAPHGLRHRVARCTAGERERQGALPARAPAAGRLRKIPAGRRPRIVAGALAGTTRPAFLRVACTSHVSYDLPHASHHCQVGGRADGRRAPQGGCAVETTQCVDVPRREGRPRPRHPGVWRFRKTARRSRRRERDEAGRAAATLRRVEPVAGLALASPKSDRSHVAPGVVAEAARAASCGRRPAPAHGRSDGARRPLAGTPGRAGAGRHAGCARRQRA